MHEIKLSKNALYSSRILELVNLMGIPHFAGVKMRDELTGAVGEVECGIVNLNTSSEPGSHWICYHCIGKDRYFFDSFSEPPPLELLGYLKSDSEWDMPVIKRNSLTVQHAQSSECGSLCLYVLKKLSLGIPFPEIIEFLNKRYHKLPTPLLKCSV